MPSVVIHGFSVPVFPSADEQLNYARSWFEEIGEKKAALSAVNRLYPDARTQWGEASLDLAYLELGNDYRLADRQACLNALKRYRNIITNFASLPQIGVKARWYSGWIYCDLLKEIDLGLEQFRLIARAYPKIKMSPALSAPWINLAYPMDPKNDSSVYGKSNHHWAGIALVEIIRHAPEDNTAFQAFEKIRKNYWDDLAAGFALRLMLNRPDLYPRLIPFMDKFLKENRSNAFLDSDIRSLAARVKQQPNETGNR